MNYIIAQWYVNRDSRAIQKTTELIEEIKTERERVLRLEDEIFKCEMFRLKEPNNPKRNKQNYHKKIL